MLENRHMAAVQWTHVYGVMDTCLHIYLLSEADLA